VGCARVGRKRDSTHQTQHRRFSERCHGGSDRPSVGSTPASATIKIPSSQRWIKFLHPSATFSEKLGHLPKFGGCHILHILGECG